MSVWLQEQLGFEMDDWVSEVYPEPLDDLVIDYYYIMTNTTALRQATSGITSEPPPFPPNSFFPGHLIQKILQDTGSLINGTLSPADRKMFIYSAHDFNVGNMLHSLGAYALDQSPPYGACIIFEVHELSGEFGLKVSQRRGGSQTSNSYF